LFSPPAAARLNKLEEEGLLNRIIIADTVMTSSFSEINPRIEVVPSTELSARIIRTLVSNESMGKLLIPFNAEKYLKSPNLFNA
jgi:ribose-phosphate pyrophosphokinase